MGGYFKVSLRSFKAGKGEEEEDEEKVEEEEEGLGQGGINKIFKKRRRKY